MSLVSEPLAEDVVLEDGQALIEGKVCVLIHTDGADNYYADAETGEFVAYAVTKEFRVETVDDFNWVMGLMLNKEAEIAAVEQSPEVLAAKAVLANADKLRKAQYSKLNWLELRFREELGLFAKEQLKGKREKTFTSLMGSVSWRQAGGNIGATDKKAEKAIAWSKDHCVSAVKVEHSFLVSGIPDAKKKLIEKILTSKLFFNEIDTDDMNDEEEIAFIELMDEVSKEFNVDESNLEDFITAVKDAFVFEPIRDNVTIKTGVARP